MKPNLINQKRWACPLVFFATGLDVSAIIFERQFIPYYFPIIFFLCKLPAIIVYLFNGENN